MKTTIRTNAISLLILASLCGCSLVVAGVSETASLASHLIPSRSKPAPAAPPSPDLDAYKTQVAYRVMERNPGQTFSGSLPPMLPAIVVLNITVNKNGELKSVEVQRSRDPNASRVAVDSMRRSEPLPKPVNLLANSEAVTFSETFLFNDQYRFQLRSVAGPQ
ncbi:MAG: energy transducer TonB family protein [Telluria sp.]